MPQLLRMDFRRRPLDSFRQSVALGDAEEMKNEPGEVSLRAQTAAEPQRGFFFEGAVIYMAVGQNLRYLFGDHYPPKVVYFKGFWDVHRGTGVLTHCHITFSICHSFSFLDGVLLVSEGVLKTSCREVAGLKDCLRSPCGYGW